MVSAGNWQLAIGNWQLARDGRGFVSAVSTKMKVKCVSSLVFICIMHRAQLSSVPAACPVAHRTVHTVCPVAHRTVHCRVSSGTPHGTLPRVQWHTARYTPCVQWHTARYTQRPSVTFKCYVLQSKAKHEQGKIN